MRSPLPCLLALALLLPVSGALAQSTHFSTGTTQDPAAELHSLYAWTTLGSGRLNVVLELAPFVEPAGTLTPVRFGDDVLYELHVALGNSLADHDVYQLRFTRPPLVRQTPPVPAFPGGGAEPFAVAAETGPGGGLYQTYSLTHANSTGTTTVLVSNGRVAPANLGPRAFLAVLKGSSSSTSYDNAYAAQFIASGAGGERVWAGPRDEAEYGDEAAFADLLTLRAKGVAQNAYAGFNTLAIVLELPIVRILGATPNPGPTMAQTVGLWASASRRKATVLKDDGSTVSTGPWVQVSRVGFPFFAAWLLGQQDRALYGRTTPKTDVANFGASLLSPVLVRDAAAMGFYSSRAISSVPFETNRVDLLDFINLKNVPTANAHAFTLPASGDVLRVDLGTTSSFPNGRPLPTTGTDREPVDSRDTWLAAILVGLSVPVSDGVDYNDKNFLTAFPWLALPWEGLNQGHGKPTP